MYSAPFPLRATKQLPKALHYTSRAIAESVSGDTLEPFSQVVKEGVSLDGDIIPVGNGNELRNPRNLIFLENGG